MSEQDICMITRSESKVSIGNLFMLSDVEASIDSNSYLTVKIHAMPVDQNPSSSLDFF